MEEIVRPVPKNSEDRDKKDLLSTSLQVHLFWKFLSKSYRYLPQGPTPGTGAEVSLFCFMSVIYAQEQK